MKLRWQLAQALEIRWWRNYLHGKEKEDYLTWKRSYWTTFLEKIDVHLHPQERVLDAGCGPAGIFLILSEQQVTAVDPLLESYAQQLEHFQYADYPYVEFIASPLEEFQVSSPYDTVFCLNAINHVRNLSMSFDKLVEATRPGGRLIVSIDAHNYKLFKRIFQLLPGDALHPHQYTLEEYQRMLSQRGCTINYTVLYQEEFLFNYYVIVATKAE